MKNITNQTSKSLISTDSFATSNPYKNLLDYEQTFRCDVPEAVHIRLDQERGFEIEQDFDFLYVEWNGYRGEFTGSIEQLPDELKQADWFDTNSTFLHMRFYSDNYVKFKEAADT